MYNLAITSKEMRQEKILKKLEKKEINQAQASKILKITKRQVRNKLKRYINDGVSGLIHKNRGRTSTRKWDPTKEKLAIDLLKSEWKGFGPKFASEKLNELHEVKISAETLRKAMIKAHVWFPKKKRADARKRRERKAVFGIMIQLNGSPHAWFENRGPKCTLLVFIDDATSKIVWLEFVKSESVKDVMTAARHYFEKYGLPVSFYVDHGSVFSVNLNNKDRLLLSQFERAMKELGIEVIHAHSPQAKGRVERANKTLQDRLIKDMRLANISTMEQGSQFVQNGYIEKHNAQFAVEARKHGNAHRELENYDLDKILCIKDNRKIQNDFVVSYKNRLLQLTKQKRAYIRPKEVVTVYEQFDNTIMLGIRGYDLAFKEIKERKPKLIEQNVYNNQPKVVHPNSRAWV